MIDIENLEDQKCQACEGLTLSLTTLEAQTLMPQIPGWTLNASGTEISRRFEFKNFYKVMMWVNAVAFMAQSEGHHPDILLGYNYCEVKFTTHALKGLSHNDFICAAKVNALGV